MKAVTTVIIVLLLAATVGLGIALFQRHHKAVEIKKTDDGVITAYSNRLTETATKLEETEKVAMKLETNLTEKVQENTTLSNSLLKMNADLAKAQREAEAAAEAAKAAAEAAKVEMAKRDARITELAGTIGKQDQELDGLNSKIESLSKAIADTEKKLIASEGDRAFLLKELKRLQAEKADLERQFNDLAVLRAQVSKLREELSVAKRIEWIKSGIYGAQFKKGAELLMTPNTPPAPKTNFNLNVELKQDAGAQIIPPPAPSAQK